jgi:hypothetical protein
MKHVEIIKYEINKLAIYCKYSLWFKHQTYCQIFKGNFQFPTISNLMVLHFTRSAIRTSKLIVLNCWNGVNYFFGDTIMDLVTYML